MEPAADKLCLACGYDLRAVTGDRCPECGGWFDVAGELTPTLPWAHRRRVGRVRGYLKTVWMLSREPGRLGEELVRTGDIKAARRFRRLTVMVAFVTLAVTAYLARLLWPEYRDLGWGTSAMSLVMWPPESHISDWIGVLVWGWSFWIGEFAILPMLFAMVGTAGWFVVRRNMDAVRWNRALALAPYTCAPLAMMPAAIAISWGLYGLAVAEDATEHWPLLVGFAPGVLVALWMTLHLVLMKRATGCGVARVVIVAGVMPVIWTVLVVVIFVAVHGVTTFLILFCRRL